MIGDAILDRAREEWVAEAEANFTFNTKYCRIAGRLYATMAAWYALSRNMSNPDPDPHLVFADPRKQSSWYWTAAAVEFIERAEALRWIEAIGWEASFQSDCAEATAGLHRIAEHREQLRILREMVGNVE